MRRAAILLAAAFALGAGAASPAHAAFGFKAGAAGFSAAVTEEDGSPATKAGSHPYAMNVALAFELAPSGRPEGDLRDLFLELPPGLIENPRAVGRCSEALFSTPRSSPHEASASGESCPEASQIGTVELTSAAGTRTFGLFNLTPPPGAPARIGFNAYGAPVSFIPALRQAQGEYGLTLGSRDFTQLYEVRAIELEIWGNPWASAHDGQRGDCLNEIDPLAAHGSCAIDLSKQTHSAWAYLTLPSSCSAPLSFTATATSWAGASNQASSTSPTLVDCAGLDFAPTALIAPSTALVSSPTGLAFSLNVSQGGLVNPSLRYPSRVRRAVIVLPPGITINPSVGAGLGACSEAQFAAESPSSLPGQGCPNPAKIGTATVESPLVEDSLSGSLFIATPFANPFGSPYALYFVAKSPERGFIVKVAGKLEADPVSGQLTATFEDLPQLPYSKLKIEFREGQRAPLVSPASCGVYSSQVTLAPWSDPVATIKQSSSFQIAKGITSGGACPSGGAPFAPRATAGTLNSNAGSKTPFYLHLTRTDPEQEITSYSATLPPGLLGAIAGIAYCPDQAIAAAKFSSGTAELTNPSCPAASEIGHTYSGYGAGLAPAYARGSFYLAGPYNGAPLSVVAINPAIVGPFDLGTIVIRSAIRIDPRSAQVTIDSSASDPIPHIFAGIPLRLRDVRVYIDRPGFMRTPTSCSRFSIVSALSGADVPFDNPRAAFATATVPYQASNCVGLGFAPKFSLAIEGSAKRRAYPPLRATFTPRPGDANIAAASVTLPPSIFFDQDNIRAVCTGPEAEADACPAGSVVGRVRALTPLLPEPLEGPVYLRSSRNPLPDLAATLHWRGIRIVIAGRIDSHRGGIRARFEGLPDAAVSRFGMTLFGGPKRGLLVNAENLCRRPQVVVARFVGQSNLGLASKSRLGMRCGKR